jgi:hypothetical protein
MMIMNNRAVLWRLGRVGLLLFLGLSLCLAGSRVVRAKEGVPVTLPEVVNLHGYGLALENEILTLGANCSELVRDLRLLSEPLDNFLGLGETFAHYQLNDEVTLKELLKKSGDGCRLLPNYLLATSGTHSVFGSPFDNPNNRAPDPTEIGAVLTLLNKDPLSAFNGVGVTVAVFDSYCPGGGDRPASDLFLQGMGLTDITLRTSFIRPIQLQHASTLPNQCSHNEAIISLLKTIAPEATVELWPVLDERGLGALSGLLQALHAFAQTTAADRPYVINLSLGILGQLGSWENVFQQLTGPGHLIVAAAGNWRSLPTPPVALNGAQAPAALQQFVLAVHATNGTGERTAYSNLGAVGAPGGQHDCTTEPTSGAPTVSCLIFYNSLSPTGASGWKGSSYATALVSGVTALLLEQDATRSLATVRWLLWCGARGADYLLDVTYTLAQCSNQYELGDAPDGVNHVGVPMHTYPTAVLATFPTIYSDPVGPVGPIHWRPRGSAWLGRTVSAEKEADQLPDADTVTNLDPGANLADRDGADDGILVQTLSLPECAITRFQYGITVASKGIIRYTNVWIDYNRDGDWNDSVLCIEAGKRYRVSEWAVRNQAVPATLGLGYRVRTTPAFRSVTSPTPSNPLWLRISLSDQRSPLIPGATVADGRGPVQGYRFGETEDYLITGELSPASLDSLAAANAAAIVEGAGETAEGDFDGFNDELLESVTDAAVLSHKFYLPLLTK